MKHQKSWKILRVWHSFLHHQLWLHSTSSNHKQWVTNVTYILFMDGLLIRKNHNSEIMSPPFSYIFKLRGAYNPLRKPCNTKLGNRVIYHIKDKLQKPYVILDCSILLLDVVKIIYVYFMGSHQWHSIGNSTFSTRKPTTLIFIAQEEK